MRKLILLGCLSYFVIGLAHVVAGALLEPVMANYDLSYGAAGQWITNQFLGFLLGVLAAPAITSRIGRRSGLVLALGFLTAAEAIYSMLPPWDVILVAAPVAGFGFGMTEAVVGALIMDVFARGKASVMGWLEVAFGAGALAMPGLAALLIRDGIWMMSFPVLTALAGISMLLWMTLSFGPADEAVAHTPRTAKPAAAAPADGPAAAAREADEPIVAPGLDGPAAVPAGGALAAAKAEAPASGRGWLGYGRGSWPLLAVGMAFFFLYVGLEMVFANYLPSIMTKGSGIGEAEASAVLSLFWATMVAGRLLIGFATRAAGYRVYLLGSVASTLAALVLLATAGTLTWTLVLVALAGFCMAGIFAVALIYVNERLPGMTDRTTSLLVACGGLGGAIFPKLGGWLFDLHGWQRLLQLTAVMGAVLLVLLLVLLALRGRQAAEA
ncbi:MFS transporter [Paenibacillus pasadenensis]|uniref:Glucose/mannose:H+ symporter GlcP n=1 Tax=Paenibacillus pasadenensis TaxID=217090 RepID=A0A2N5MZX8_9BACL|nr:MFS transporter [Paenibacillus pasadenensis]PLT43638.1 Glucose/mannose:H+ symporter GlcP [Paenibacillus pasadenensis]